MKRKSKQQREKELKAALRQRIADIATGAAGYKFDDESEFATATLLGRLVPAVKVQFGTENNQYLFNPMNLEHYESIDSITDFYWTHNVRA